MKKFGIILLLAAAVLPAHAQDKVRQNEAFGFLRYEQNPARAGLAGAGAASAVGGGAFAAFGNPASAVLAPSKFEAAASYARRSPNVSANTDLSAGISAHAGKGLAFTAAFSRISMEKLDLGGISYSPSQMVAGAGLAIALGGSLALGADVNYAKEQLLEDYSLSSVAADVTLQYSKGGLGLAGGVRSLGGKINSESGIASSLPTSAMLAASYNVAAGPVGLTLCADADYYLSGNWSAAAGIEASIAGTVLLRAGYRASSELAVTPSHLALGAGLSLGFATIDIAWLTASETIGNSLVAGARVNF